MATVSRQMSQVVESMLGSNNDVGVLKGIAAQYDQDPTSISKSDYNLLVSLKNLEISDKKLDKVRNASADQFSDEVTQRLADNEKRRNSFNDRLTKFIDRNQEKFALATEQKDAPALPPDTPVQILERHLQNLEQKRDAALEKAGEPSQQEKIAILNELKTQFNGAQLTEEYDKQLQNRSAESFNTYEAAQKEVDFTRAALEQVKNPPTPLNPLESAEKRLQAAEEKLAEVLEKTGPPSNQEQEALRFENSVKAVEAAQKEVAKASAAVEEIKDNLFKPPPLPPELPLKEKVANLPNQVDEVKDNTASVRNDQQPVVPAPHQQAPTPNIPEGRPPDKPQLRWNIGDDPFEMLKAMDFGDEKKVEVKQSELLGEGNRSSNSNSPDDPDEDFALNVLNSPAASHPEQPKNQAASTSTKQSEYTQDCIAQSTKDFKTAKANLSVAAEEQKQENKQEYSPK